MESFLLSGYYAVTKYYIQGSEYIDLKKIIDEDTSLKNHWIIIESGLEILYIDDATLFYFFLIY